jgi:hypothetical protein
MRMILTATAALLLFAFETSGASLFTFASVECDYVSQPCHLGSTYGAGSASWDTGLCFLDSSETSPAIAGYASGWATYGRVSVGLGLGADLWEEVTGRAVAAFSDELTFSDPSAAFLQLFYHYSIMSESWVFPVDSVLDVAGGGLRCRRPR